jgi:protein arginine kinase activator
MLCQDCGEKEATIHLTQAIEGKKKVLDLCEACAEKRGFSNPLKNVPFPLGDFLASMVLNVQKGDPHALEHVKCSGCELTFTEFSKTGRFGCGMCYEAFRPQLDDLLRKIHGANRHIGGMPSGSHEKMQPMKEERELREQIREAVSRENYELAAELRDRLKAMVAQKD